MIIVVQDGNMTETNITLISLVASYILAFYIESKVSGVFKLKEKTQLWIVLFLFIILYNVASQGMISIVDWAEGYQQLTTNEESK